MATFTNSPTVTDIKLKRKSRLLDITFDTGETYQLSCEILRVYSPSADVHGHGKPVLVTHKKQVNINTLEAVGNYAVKITFDDGHNTGLFLGNYCMSLPVIKSNYGKIT